MIQLLDVPDGFWSRGLLPYDPELRQLLPVGQVTFAHLCVWHSFLTLQSQHKKPHAAVCDQNGSDSIATPGKSV